MTGDLFVVRKSLAWQSSLVVLWVLWATVAWAVVPAVSPRDALPAVSVYARVPTKGEVVTVALLPLADAPRTPGSGRLADEALQLALEARGIRVVAAPLPADAAGAPTPAPHLGGPALAKIGQQARANVTVAGKVLELYSEERYRPYTVVRRRGVYVEVPEEVDLETRMSVSLRVVDVKKGRLLFSASGRYGPVRNLDPREAVRLLMEAVVDRWLSR
jgi:hypothetical protein